MKAPRPPMERSLVGSMESSGYPENETLVARQTVRQSGRVEGNYWASRLAKATREMGALSHLIALWLSMCSQARELGTNVPSIRICLTRVTEASQAPSLSSSRFEFFRSAESGDSPLLCSVNLCFGFLIWRKFAVLPPTIRSSDPSLWISFELSLKTHGLKQ